MQLNITVLPGDGIGPEVTRQAVRVLRAVSDLGGHDFRFEERAIGGAAFERFGSPLPPATLDACLESDAVLLGAVGAPKYDSLPTSTRPEAGLLTLRRALGGGSTNPCSLSVRLTVSGLACKKNTRRKICDILLIPRAGSSFLSSKIFCRTASASLGLRLAQTCGFKASSP